MMMNYAAPVRGMALLMLVGVVGCGGSGSEAEPSPPTFAPPPAPLPPPPSAAGILQLSAESYTAAEADAVIRVTVTRSGGSEGEVGASLVTFDGTAVAGQDYEAIDSTVTFAEGDSEPKIVTIAILDDTIDEMDETVSLTLAGPTGGADVGTPFTAMLTITDDDAAPTFSVGGSVSGLQGSGLILRNNGGEDLSVNADGTFLFAQLLEEGAAYDVSISAQPTAPDQICTVESGSGTLAATNVTDVMVACAAPTPLQSVVFERFVDGQSDIYLIKEDGTGLILIAGSAEEEDFAGTTPGGRLVFSRSVEGGPADLFSINADGSDEIALTDSVEAEKVEEITGEGRIIFSRLASGAVVHEDLYAINADGSGIVALADSADNEEYEGLSSSERLIFSSVPTAGGNGDLYGVNADGSAPVPLAATADDEEFAAVAPSGRVIFSRRVGAQRDVYSVNADGTALVPLAITLENEQLSAVTADGQVIFDRSVGLFIVDGNGTGELPLSDVFGFTSTFSGFAADGSVIFSRSIHAPDSTENIYLIGLDAVAETVLADSADDERLVGVTPNGRIIYRRLVNEQEDIYSIEPDGSNPVALADTSDIEVVATISPSGQVIFGRLVGDQADLYVIDPDGAGAAITLANSAESEEFQALTDEGRVIFTRAVGGQTDLFSVRIDGSDERVLANSPDPEYLRRTVDPFIPASPRAAPSHTGDSGERKRTSR